MTSESGSFPYDVFVSYSRRDLAFARKLHATLEAYVPPAGLGLEPRSLVVFRDETDIRGTRYYESIDEHLKDARALLVICSPDARRSHFVDDEVVRFVRLRPEALVVAVLQRGKANNETDCEDEKAFPENLARVLGLPLAIDLRGFDARVDEFDAERWEKPWYSLLATLFSIERRVIEERDRRRKLVEKTRRAKELWHEADEDLRKNRGGDALHRLARAYEIAPGGALKQNLSRALSHRFPRWVVHGIWEGENRILSGFLDRDGERLVAWDERNRVFGIDVGSGACLLSGTCHGAPVQHGLFLTSDLAATYDQAGDVRVLDFASKDSHEVLRHPGAVVWVVGSPSGSLLATISTQGVIDPETVVTLWDRQSGSVRFRHGLGGMAPWPVFFDAGDDIAVVDTGTTFRAVDASGRETTTELPAPAQVMWSLPGRRVLALCAGNPVLVEIDDDRRLSVKVLPPFEQPVRKSVVDRQRRRLFAVARDGSLVLRDLETQETRVCGTFGTMPIRDLHLGANDSVAIVEGEDALRAISATGRLIWTRPYDFKHWGSVVQPGLGAVTQIALDMERMQCYGLADGEPLGEAITRPAPISRFLYSESHRRAITLGGDRRVMFWTMRPRPLRDAAAVGRRIDHVIVEHGKVRLVYSDLRESLRLVDPFRGAVVGPPLRDVPGLLGIVLDADDSFGFGIARGGVFLRWRLAGDFGEAEGIRFPCEIAHSAISPTMDRDAVLLADGTILVVTTRGPLSVEGEIHHAGDGRGPAGLQFSPDGTRLATWSDDGWVRLWDVANRSEACSPIQTGGVVYGALWDPSASRAVAWSSANECVVKDLRKDVEVRLKHFGEGTILSPGVTAARFSTNGALVFSASSDRSIRVWDAETGEQILPPLQHSGIAQGIAPSYDDRTLLSWSGFSVSLWDLRNGRRAVPDVRHDQTVSGAFWTHAEDRVVTYDDANAIRMWDRETGLSIMEAMRHPRIHGEEDGAIARIALSKDDTQLLSWSRDGAACLWSLDLGDETVRWQDVVEGATASRWDEDTFEVAELGAAEVGERKARAGPGSRAMDSEEPSEGRGRSLDLASRVGVIPSRVLSRNAVQQMLRDEDLFDAVLHPGVSPRAHGLRPVFGGRVVFDAARSLLWQQGGSTDPLSLEAAAEYVRGMRTEQFCGFSDWRFPTLEEAMSVMSADRAADGMHISTLFDRRPKWIWTWDFAARDSIWMVSYGWGTCTLESPGESSAHVRVVRWLDVPFDDVSGGEPDRPDAPPG